MSKPTNEFAREALAEYLLEKQPVSKRQLEVPELENLEVPEHPGSWMTIEW